MSGELYNLLNVVNYLNSVVNKDIVYSFEIEKYINSLSFMIEEQERSSLMIEIKVDLKGFESYLQENSCNSVLVSLGTDNDINKSTFTNKVPKQVMICQFEEKYEVWRYDFDFNGESWDVCYQYIGLYEGAYKYRVRNIESELNRLIECYRVLSEFALEIEEKNWVNYFKIGKEKIEQLNDNVDLKTLMSNIISPFGGMGSWNDLPPYLAHLKGFDDEYKRYSNNLYKQLHIVLESVCNRNFINNI